MLLEPNKPAKTYFTGYGISELGRTPEKSLDQVFSIQVDVIVTYGCRLLRNTDSATCVLFQLEHVPMEPEESMCSSFSRDLSSPVH